MWEWLGFEVRQELAIDTLTTSVVSSSRIDRETLDAEQVRSSVARHLGIEVDGADRTDESVEGKVAMTVDAAVNYDKPLTRKDFLTGPERCIPPATTMQKPLRWASGVKVQQGRCA